MPKVVIVTTSQPSTNPRVVKEAEALSKSGYNVTILYCYRAPWAIEADKELFLKVRWSHQLIGGTPFENVLLYHKNRLRRIVAQKTPFLRFSVERSICQAFDELYDACINLRADLYIAHNPGALPVVALAAQKLGKPYGFDAEDFHRAEYIIENGHTKNIKKLEDKYLPKATYISAASPLIAEAYKECYKELKSILVINNVFPLKQQPLFRTQSTISLRLFWFSQTLGRDRGLEDVLNALDYLKDIPIEIGLLGNSNPLDKNYLGSFINSPNHKLLFFDFMSESNLIQLSSTFDIGLALERSTPLNRNICLTNKLFTYLLAGNAILASKTKAQGLFMEGHSNIGHSYSIGDYKRIADILRQYKEQPDMLYQHRLASWTLAKNDLNWEIEQEKLLAVVKKIV